MALYGIFLVISFLLLIFSLIIRFKPLFSLAGSFLFLGLSIYYELSFPIKIVGFIFSFIIFEFISDYFFLLTKRKSEDTKLRNYVGQIGKIRDVVNDRKKIFLIHCCGSDFTAVGDVKLGDHAEIVDVDGHNVVVRKIVKG